ncbi:MAG: FAD-dependent oxidoreductase [Alphaproteobacteria bacterium]|nr:FAD-dependent oxidoreductase [Alphaproteobacteria bacterium]
MKVVVVGAGVFGASVAYHLAREGAEVVVFDRDDAGRATSAGAGIVCPWLSAREDEGWLPLAYGAGRYYPELVQDLAAEGETDLGYRRVGLLVVPDEAKQLDAVEQRLAVRRQVAPEMGVVKRVSPQEAVGMFPALRPGQPATHIENAARVNGRLMAAGLLRAAQKRGAVVRAGSPEIVAEGGAAKGVRLGGEVVGADAVVVTAGAWAPALLSPLGVSLRVEPQKGQIVHLRMNGVDTSHWPVLQPMNSFYLLTFDDSRVVIGATREYGSGFDYRVTAAGQKTVLDVALAVAPGLADGELIETRIGFRPMAADELPMIGAVSGVPGLFVGNGLGPSGLTLGPFAGRLLADAVLGRTGEIGLGAYDPLRYLL